MGEAATPAGTACRRRAMGTPAALVVGPFTWPSSARPQPKRVAVILSPSTAPDPDGPARKWLSREFAKHGLVDGRDIEITLFRADRQSLERRGASAFADTVRQSVALRPAVILTHASGFNVKTHFLPAAGGVPIVAWSVDDGTAHSLEALNRSGENVTGSMYPFIEFVTKRFELMKELRPSARRAAFLVPPDLRGPRNGEKQEASRREKEALWEPKLRKLGLEFTIVELPPDSTADVVIAALQKARIDLVEVSVWWVAQGPLAEGLWGPLAKSGFLASGVERERAEAGALLTGWTTGYVESAVRLAARVLRGARAVDLPVERAMKFSLAINLRAARTLGITVSPSILMRMDEVFE